MLYKTHSCPESSRGVVHCPLDTVLLQSIDCFPLNIGHQNGSLFQFFHLPQRSLKEKYTWAPGRWSKGGTMQPPSDTENISYFSTLRKTEEKRTMAGKQAQRLMLCWFVDRWDFSTTKSELLEWNMFCFVCKELAQCLNNCMPNKKQAKGRWRSTLALPHSPWESVLSPILHALEPEAEPWSWVRLNSVWEGTLSNLTLLNQDRFR